jgi:hypothetical protein
MPRIMCKQTLWRRLGKKGSPPSSAAEPVIPGASLGSWAAKSFRPAGKDLVIALNERTYLTVVFPLSPRKDFRANFARAVADALTDLGMPEAIVQAESTAVEFQPFACLTSPSVARALDDLEFFCRIELDYHSDLRKVQRNLNDVPHPDRKPCVAVDAVNELFEAVAVGRSNTTH